jgi:omega-amidase
MSGLTVTLVQTNIDWLAPQKNFAQLTQLLSDVADTDLIVLPETFATGFAFEQLAVKNNDDDELASSTEILSWLKQTARDKNAVIVGSVAVKLGDKNANRLYWVTPQGGVSYYDKRHLFRMGNEHNYVVAGKQREIFTVKGVRFLATVCYDLRFPVWSRNKNDYDVLLNIANWPALRRRIWDTLLPARAIENQCYVVAVNRVGLDGKSVAHSGGTAFYDFKGDLLAKAEDDQSQLLQLTLDMDALNKFKTGFPAYLDGDEFELV